MAIVAIVGTSVFIEQAVVHATQKSTTPWVRPGIARVAVPRSSVKASLASVSVPVSQDQLAWVALGSLNEVEMINAATGEVYGSPIPLPTNDSPVAIAYWRPNLGYTTATSSDPQIVVLSNNTSSGTDYVTFIDALTKVETSTISLGGTHGTSVAASTEYDVAVVSDTNSGGTASRLKVLSMKTDSLIQSFNSVATTAQSVSSVSFDGFGLNVEAVSPNLHKVYYFQQTGSGSTTFTQPTGSTYTGGSTFDPQYIAADPTTPGASTFYLSGNATSKKLWSITEYVGGFGTTMNLVTSFSHTPGPLQVSAGSATAYVTFPLMTSSNVGVVNLSTASTTYLTTTTAPSAVGLSWDSGTLLVGDGSSGTTDLDVVATYASSVSSVGTVAGTISGIAMPISSFIHYNIYAVNNPYVSVIDSSTGGVINNFYDANSPLTAISSIDGRDIFVVNETGGGGSGLDPEVVEYSTAVFGSSGYPVVGTYVINQTSGSPFSYSLSNVPVIAQAAMSPNGDSLLLTDSANSVVFTMDVATFDVPPLDPSSHFGKIVNEVSLNGSTAENPKGISILPDGSYAYVSSQPVSGGGAGGITVLSANGSTTGYNSPSYISGSSLSDTPPSGYSAISLVDPTQIQTSNNGQLLYVLDTNSSMPLLFAFAVGATGALSTDPNPAFAAGNNPVSFSLSPEDSVAYISDGTTDLTKDMNLTAGIVGDRVGANDFSSGISPLVPNSNSSTPDGQWFATSYNTGPLGLDEVGIFNSVDGSTASSAALNEPATSITVSPVSSSQWLSSTLAYDGQLGWAELLQGGINQSERADSSMVDFNTAGTPSDAPGASAGTNTDTRSYSLSVNSFSIPDLGLPLDLTASYDSARVADGMDSSTSLPSFAFGWRLSTGITATQNPTSGTLDPCMITVTQSDGTVIYFNPSTSFTTSCPTAGYEPLPWEQASLTVVSSCTGSGTDACWQVTNLLSGESTYIDATASAHPVLSQQDRNGNSLTYTYSSGVLQSVSNAGRSLSFTYPTAGTGTCPSSFNSQTVAKCWVVTDPIGRTVTYMLVGNSTSGYDLAGITLAPPSGSSASSATYAFSYSGHLLTSWWDPQNYANYAGNTAEATDTSYASSLDWVTQVTAPQVTNQGVNMSSTYTPTTTFQYVTADLFTGSSQVIIKDANTNYNAATSSSLPGANVTLDSYVDWGLSAQVQGYGPSELPSINPTAVTSETATTLRDPLTLMPVESLSALADTSTGAMFNSGVSFTAYDILGNAIETWSPGPTSNTWATTTSSYNQFNEPMSSTDANGNVSTYTYSATGQVLTTTTPPTNTWTSSPVTSNYYNANGTLCASRDANEVATYGALTSCSTTHDTYETYDSAGDLLTTVNPLGDVSSSYFDADGNQCASLTPDGYATGERLTSCPTSAQPDESVNVTRNVFGSVTSATSPSNAPGGTSWTYFNVDNDRIASVSVLGNPSSCNPLTTTTCLYTSYSSFNQDGETVSSTTPTATSGNPGPTSTTLFDPNGTSVASVPPAGNVSGATPANFEQVTISNSIGSTVSTTPAASLSAGCSTMSTSSLCPNTSYSTSDAEGETTGTYLPNSAGTGTISSSTSYDPEGNVSTSASPTGSSSTSTTTNVYDVAGDQLESTTVGSSGSSSVTTGSTTTYEPSGPTCWSTPLAWSGSSAPTCSSPPLSAGNQTTVDYYDNDGHLVAVAGPGSNPYAAGNTSGCNPLTTSNCAYTTYYTFNEAGQQVSSIQPQDANGAYPTTTNYFDASGNTVAVTEPGGSPGTCNPVTTSTCTDTIYSTYDADGRVDQKTYTDGTPTVTYTYNNDGSRGTMVDGTGTSTYSYDAVGRMTASTNGSGKTDTWGYNTTDQLICLSYPNASGNTCSTSGAGTSSPPTGDLTYTYNQDGTLSSQVTWTGVTLTYAYDCGGALAWVSTGTASQSECTTSSDSDPAIPTSSSAVTTSYTNDPTAGLLSQQATTTNGGSTNLLKFAFGRDQQGRLTSSTPTVNATAMNTDSYSYDSSSRVSSGPITGTSGSNIYNYTAAGGITADTTNFGAAAYAPDGELCWTSAATSGSCTSAGSHGAPSGATVYSYNADGERTASTPASGNPESLGWETASNHLICVNTNGTTCSTSSPSSTTTLYSYNGEGLRATSTSQSITNSFVWDSLAQKMLADSYHDYIYAPGSSTPNLQIQTTTYTTTPTVDLLIEDSSRNTRGIIQIQGDTSTLNSTLVKYTDYDVYGNPIDASGGASNPGGLSGISGPTNTTSEIGFGSSYIDGNNLNYLINRYYDPASGQFISKDSLLSVSQQAFVYSGNNPIEYYDPSGKMLTCGDNNSIGCGGGRMSWSNTLSNVTTESYCISLNLNVTIGNVFLEGCILHMIDGSMFGFSVTVGGGIGLSFVSPRAIHAAVDGLKAKAINSMLNFSLSINLSYEQSNAKNLNDLGSWFSYANGSLGVGPGSVNYGRSWDSTVTQQYWGVGFKVAGDSSGASAAYGISWTKVWTVDNKSGWWDPLRWIFIALDWPNPKSPCT